MTKSDSISNLALALATAQREMPNPKKESDNPFFKSRYADLASVISTITPALAKNDLALMQFVETAQQAGEVAVTTMLAHGKSGEFVSSTISAKPTDAKPQTIGSTITYLRRYAALAIVGRAAENEDDDGNSGSGRATPPQENNEPTITEEQAIELNAMIVETGSDLDKFKAYFGIAGRKIEDLPASRFATAKKMLSGAAAKKGKDGGK
jgi:ERF superfamily